MNSWQKYTYLFLLIIHTSSYLYAPEEKPMKQLKKLNPQKTVYLIDGSSFLYRAYYGLRPLHTSQGIPVQAVYSFARMIKKMITTFSPEYIALVWDSPGKTERHEIYPEYKATRQAPPSDLFTQKEYIQEFADLIGLAQVQQSGVEADDLMYSIARDVTQQDFTAVFVTSDKDMGQAITEKIVLFDPFKEQIIDAAAIQEKMGFPVEKMPFYFALLGDTSDNIPGVHGIGKKGAQDLVNQFESLEDLYENLDEVEKQRTRQALAENQKNAFLSRDLFLLKYHKTGTSLESLKLNPSDWVKAKPLFKELEFKTLIQEIEKEEGVVTQKVKLSEFAGYNFICVQTEEQLQQLCDEIKYHKKFAIDTELTGLRPLQDRTVGMCVCYKKGTAYYIPFGHETIEQQLPQEIVVRYFKPLFEDPTIKKYMHFGKFDQMSLYAIGIPHVRNFAFDTLVAAHLVTEDWQRIGLKALSDYYLQEPMQSFADAVTGNNYKNFGQLPLMLATEYAASDAHQTFQLVPILQQKLHKLGMQTLYETVEHPLINVLLAMQIEGIYCDKNVLADYDKKVTAELETIRNKIVAIIGEHHKDINLNSPKQLIDLLFHELQLPPQKKTAGKTGYSTDQKVLEELAKIHPVPGLIIQWRTLTKLKNTYIDALPHYINPNTGKIHATFNQTGVATGRLSSSEPNLQNIPVESPQEFGITIRQAFKAEPGHVFLSADYSQIELRILAYLSQDTALVEAFERGDDIHALTAAKLFDVPLEHVTNEMRQIGKRINFSILYGLTPYGLSQDLGIPFKDAKLYIEKYFAQYPQVSSWMESVIDFTKEHGYVTTQWGRRRYLPGIYEKNRMLYELARRMAINTKAQGTAAEIMKLGMINLTKAFQEHNLDAKLILQIHDELLISVPEQQKTKTEELVKNVLESVVEWNVPLLVTTRFGKDWQEVTK